MRVALRTGRLRRCVVPGGLDPVIALEEWQANTDPRQQRVVTAATDAAAASDRKAKAPKGRPARPGPKPKRATPRPAAPPPPEPSPSAADRLAAHVAANRARAAKTRPPEAEPSDGDGRTMADIRRSMLLKEERDMEHDWQLKQGAFVPPRAGPHVRAELRP